MPTLADTTARQPMREQVDYEAWFAPASGAREAIDVAERFLDAVSAMFP